MAKKRRKPRARTPQAFPASAGADSRPAAEGREARTVEAPTHQRAERKEQARAARENARRRIERQRRVRRGVTIVGVAGVVGIAAFLVFRTDAAGSIREETLALARAAGCTDVQTPVGSAPGGQHLDSGEPANYTQRPASSGVHDPAPLPAEQAVFTQPIREENAVHNLEHGYILLYYRAEDPEALPDDVVTRLSEIAESQDKVLVAPYVELNEGTSFAMVAWNKLWECPSNVSGSDAATLANAFIAAYKGTSNAPEGNVP